MLFVHLSSTFWEVNFIEVLTFAGLLLAFFWTFGGWLKNVWWAERQRDDTFTFDEVPDLHKAPGDKLETTRGVTIHVHRDVYVHGNKFDFRKRPKRDDPPHSGIVRVFMRDRPEEHSRLPRLLSSGDSFSVSLGIEAGEYWEGYLCLQVAVENNTCWSSQRIRVTPEVAV